MHSICLLAFEIINRCTGSCGDKPLSKVHVSLKNGSNTDCDTQDILLHCIRWSKSHLKSLLIEMSKHRV